MRKSFAMISGFLFLAAVMAAVPATAETARKYDQLQQGLGDVFPTQQPELPEMSLEHFLSIGVGIAIGSVLLQTVLDGTPAMIAGAIIGGLIGDWWYNEGLWPFEPETGIRL